MFRMGHGNGLDDRTSAIEAPAADDRGSREWGFKTRYLTSVISHQVLQPHVLICQRPATRGGDISRKDTASPLPKLAKL